MQERVSARWCRSMVRRTENRPSSRFRAGVFTAPAWRAAGSYASHRPGRTGCRRVCECGSESVADRRSVRNFAPSNPSQNPSGARPSIGTAGGTRRPTFDQMGLVDHNTAQMTECAPHAGGSVAGSHRPLRARRTRGPVFRPRSHFGCSVVRVSLAVADATHGVCRAGQAAVAAPRRPSQARRRGDHESDTRPIGRLAVSDLRTQVGRPGSFPRRCPDRSRALIQGAQRVLRGSHRVERLTGRSGSPLWAGR